jgi:hypothetical protein
VFDLTIDVERKDLWFGVTSLFSFSAGGVSQAFAPADAAENHKNETIRASTLWLPKTTTSSKHQVVANYLGCLRALPC